LRAFCCPVNSDSRAGLGFGDIADIVRDVDRDDAIASLEAEGLVVTEWSDDAHTSYDEHSHPEREVRIVLDGSMTVRTQGREHLLRPGDRIDLAAGQRHEAEVGPDGVRYLAGTSR
jgi:quercetin dioxygenase-like cupin family protein